MDYIFIFRKFFYITLSYIIISFYELLIFIGFNMKLDF